jgi:hypothetical protein
VAQPDPETERLYIAHLADAVKTVNAQQSRLIAVNGVLSTPLLALALGIVSASDTLEVSGLSFKLPLSTLLIGVSVASAVLCMLVFGLKRRWERLVEAVRERYERLGIERPPSRHDPFGASAGLEAVMEGRLGRRKIAQVVDFPSTFVIFAVILVLPIAAQVAAVLAVVDVYDSRWVSAVWIIPLLSCLSFVGNMVDT